MGNQRKRGRRNAGTVRLSQVLRFRNEVSNLKGQFMSALDDLKTKVNELAAANNALSARVTEANDKVDRLIVGATKVKDDLAAMQTAGGATPDQLAVLTAQLNGVLGVVRATDAALVDQEGETDAARGALGQ